MLPVSPARDHGLDALRAAMMLLGLVIHSAAAYTTGPDRTAWPYQDPQTAVGFDLLAISIHVFRMPVFFVMAGFFAALLYARDGRAGFIRNRVRRVRLCGLSMWWLVVGITGAFVLHANAGTKTVRYLAEAAYWIYLVHLPVVIWLQGGLATAALPAALKFFIVLVTTSSVTLLTYHYAVRGTAVGRLLNGRRRGDLRPVGALQS